MLKNTRLTDSCDTLVILISGAGYENFGDDVILSKWITVYRNYDMLLICGEHIEQHKCLGIKKHVPLHLLDSGSVDEIKDLARNYRKVLIHITGGGFCNDKFGSAPKIFSLLFQLQEFAAVIGTGLSFYPLSHDSKLMLNGINFKYLSFRDFYSRQVYEGLCSPFYGDDLLPVFAPASLSRGGKTLFVNIQNQFDLVGKLSLVAKRVCEIVAAGSYSSVVLCELCTGDLDVLNYLDIDGLKVAERCDFLAGNVKPANGDVFIGTRFHFRMLMENSGATGICIVADDYYSNKHEKTGPPCNFVPGRSVLMSVEEFVSAPFYFPDAVKKINAKINFRIIGKRIESIFIKKMMRFGILR
jgi:hypothetical protein